MDLALRSALAKVWLALLLVVVVVPTVLWFLQRFRGDPFRPFQFVVGVLLNQCKSPCRSFTVDRIFTVSCSTFLSSRPEDLAGRTFAGRRLVSERRGLLLRLQRQPRLVHVGARAFAGRRFARRPARIGSGVRSSARNFHPVFLPGFFPFQRLVRVLTSQGIKQT